MVKKLLSVFLLVIILVIPFSVCANAYQITGFTVNAEGALLASLDTGDILYSKNADLKLYPASLTKIMTAIIVLEKTPDLDSEIITISDSAIHSLDGTDSSVGGLKTDEQLTANQALHYLLMSSANECANAIAEHYAGSNVKFVEMMNAKAAELSMESTHFVNPHGLQDTDHYTTVNDVYKMVKHALSFDIFKDITSLTRYSMPATNKSQAKTLVTTNFLQDKNSQYPSYYYKYASGIKTGYTDEAGRCLISTASKGGYNYLCILMKSPPRDAKGNLIRLEFQDSKNLYDWAFSKFEYKTVVDADTPVGEAKVDLCWDSDHVSLLLNGGLSAVLPKEADSSTVKIDIHTDKEVFDAPIKKGQVMGQADIIYAGETLGSIDLIAGDTLSQSFILKTFRQIKQAFSSKVLKLVVAGIVVLIAILIIVVILMNRKKTKRKRKYRTFSKY